MLYILFSYISIQSATTHKLIVYFPYAKYFIREQIYIFSLMMTPPDAEQMSPDRFRVNI